LIDEDSLLTEEDLKKPQPPLGKIQDTERWFYAFLWFFGPLITKFVCEVGSTRKACKNCTCGRAEAEETVKLGLTTDQLNNPQSACGSVSFIILDVHLRG
jgi:hypothetical protein